MKEFGIDIRIIIKIVDEFLVKYNYLNEENYKTLWTLINGGDIKKIEEYRKEYKENPDLEKELYNYEKKNNENLVIVNESKINENKNTNEENKDNEIKSLKNGI